MLRLTIKNYVVHLPYSILLMLQMVIVLFIVNNTLVKVVDELGTVKHITFEKDLYLVENDSESEEKFLEDVTAIVGEDHVGYMYQNGTIGIGKTDYMETPPLEYISSAMEKIQYDLKEGQWFSGKENEIILGGTVSKSYHAGDEVLLTRDGEQKTVKVVGILKSPGKTIHLTGNSIENLFSCMNKGESVLFTNSKELFEWAGFESELEAGALVVDLTGREACKKELENKYNVVSLEQAKNNGENTIIKDTIGNALYMCVLVGIALVSVSIQIYMYLRRNQKEYHLYRMLGLGRGGIFGIWCTQHIINLGIVTIILYVLSNLTGKESVAETGTLNWTSVLFHAIYCLLYIMVTVVVFQLTAKKLEQFEERL